MFFPRLLLLCAFAPLPAPADSGYSATVLADEPAAYWRFEESSGAMAASSAPGFDAAGHVEGDASLVAEGPRPGAFPDFSKENRAAAFGGRRGFIRIKDAGANSPLDFAKGDTITLEAWVACSAVRDGQQVYIVGKGRTQNPGMPLHNQNWALRLRGQGGTARVSFLFRNERNRPDAGDADWHRWTSAAGFSPDGAWHHVAVSYTFGQPDSAIASIDGVETSGSWDMGGRTEAGPVVDNDEVWIGSSMGGAAGATFPGLIDEVAVYRRAVPRERLAKRFTYIAPTPQIAAAELPKDAVRVEIYERTGEPQHESESPEPPNDSGAPGAPLPPRDATWTAPPDVKTDEYLQAAFGAPAVVSKYSARGQKIDRSSPFMVRISGAVRLPPGGHRLLVRSLSGARLMMDGRVIASNPFITRRYSDNEEVPDQTSKMVVPDVRYLPPGHSDSVAAVQGDGGLHVFVLEAFVGGKNLRPELGELSVSISSDGKPFQLLAPTPQPALDDDGWAAYAAAHGAALRRLEAERRRNPRELAYWSMRHEVAREIAAGQSAPPIPAPSANLPAHNAVDHFLNVRLKHAGVSPAPLLDDAAFFRRAALDITGVIPSPEQLAEFLSDGSSQRRRVAIDRLLADPRWADHWTPYWQDVLAENPAMLKGSLNNTGPFRWWIHESFLDNKPFDRFATELILMEGSVHYGGPAGFSVASQNDAPMAAKAQILSQAFLAMEMKCARCHDAPSHRFDQAELFSLAAMLNRGPVDVPETSSVPGLSPDSHITVTLAPGSKVDPHWPFSDTAPDEPLPGMLRRHGDSRERLAALVTDPRNERFAQAIVNRMWKRYFGWGFVEPVDDWETSLPSHPELLRWLGRELVLHDYDLKHVARLILNSHAYQRATMPGSSSFAKREDRLFEAQARRRLTAEQLVDSLFAAAGKSFESEELNMDTDARRRVDDFGNLGVPASSWQFAPLSNERDRPALAMPRAQSITDVLAAFGWRESRAEPRSVRYHEPNVLQPANLANGVMGRRITRLSDDSAFTELALRDQPLRELIAAVYARILTRTPTEQELARFEQHLAGGYDARVLPPKPGARQRRLGSARAVSWSNHLNAEATRVKLEQEREAREGDPATERLAPEWREKVEDVVWALMLSPEFIHLP